MDTPEANSRLVSAEELVTKGPLPDSLPFYPEGNQYPFDATCKQIVDELRRLKWQAPGIKVDFWMSKGENPRPLAVHSIEGSNYRLTFGVRGHKQASDTESAHTDISGIDIPRKRLEVFDDFSGPNYLIYRGISWEKDRYTFRNNRKHCFAYTGSDRIDGIASSRSRMATYLIPDKYTNHEGLRLPWEPSYLETGKVVEEFTEWLSTNVLDLLKKVELPKRAS